MTTELWLVVAAIVIGFVHILLQAVTMTGARGRDWNVGPRDTAGAPLSPMAGRLERALRNFLETFPLFLAAMFVAGAADVHNAMTVYGAWMYVIARALYIPLYAFGVTYLRSLVWTVGAAGIVVILFGLS